MKNILYTCLILINCVWAQTKKIEPSIYKANNTDYSLALQINSDASYRFLSADGEYETQNDTLFLKEKGPFFLESTISLDYIQKGFKSDKINFYFSKNLAHYASDIYIGTQNKGDEKVEYKNLAILYDEKAIKDENDNHYFVIKHTDFLYLVVNQNGKPTVSKFKVPDNVAEIKATYSAHFFNNYGSNTILKMYVDQSTGKVIVSDGKEPIEFSNATEDDINKMEPLEVNIKKNWVEANGIVLKKETLEDTIDRVDWPQEKKDSTQLSATSYRFEYKIENNLKAAFAETAKTPNKILVVNFDLKNPNRKADFDACILADAERLTQKMYPKYKAEDDVFNFYLAHEKDKSLLKKYDIKDKNVTLFLNSKGNLLGYSNKSLKKEEIAYKFNTDALIRANQLSKFDDALATKKVTNKALKKLFYEATYMVSQEDVNNEFFTSEALNADVITDKTSKTIHHFFNDLYTIKSTREQVSKKWEDLVNVALAKSEIDTLFIKTAKLELINDGFTAKLFTNKNAKLLQETDYKILDYLFKHYQDIAKQEKINAPENRIKSILSNAILTNLETDGEIGTNSVVVEKTLEYYKELALLNPTDISMVQSCTTYLKNSKDPKALDKSFEFYDTYFNNVVKNDANIFESLNTIYEAFEENDWKSFKNYFADFANTIAWDVVENPAYKYYLQKAIKWSETSLTLEPTSHYYLDTLANLYFLNGEKARAIAKEQEAIQAAKNANDTTEEIAGYEKTLEKFK